MTHTKNILLISMLLFAGNSLAAEKKPVTVEDCVCTRRVVRRELVLSPSGSHVAYIVKAPAVKTNKNNYLLFVRDLAQRTRRENGRLLFQSEYLSGLRWLADGTRIAVLSREGKKSTVRIIDIDAERSELAVAHPARIEGYSISANGEVVVFSAKLQVKDGRQDPVKKAHGFPVAFDRPVSRSLAGLINPKYELYMVERAKSGKGKVRRLEFSGLGLQKEHSLATRVLVNLNLSPDGNYLLFVYRSKWLPEGWEATRLVKRVRGLGGNPRVLALYDLRSGELRLAFNAPDQYGVTTWAEDSRTFAIQINSPVGSPEYQREEEGALAEGDILMMWREAPLFAVDVESGSFRRVLPKLPRVFGVGIPLLWKRGDGPMLCRLDSKTLAWMSPQGSAWKEVSRAALSLTGNNDLYPTLTNGEVVVGVSEAPMVPPDLFLYGVRSEQTTLLTDLNPEFREIALGQVEKMEWTNQYGAKARGYLIKPVGYEAGKRYPLVIMSKSWADLFSCDTQYHTAFPPQPLANAGFVVLMARYPSVAARPKDYPGRMGEAYNWMAMVESAVELLVGRGLVDRDNLGLMGFSRTSWETDFMLTHSDFRFAAASSADSGIYNYGSYWRHNLQKVRTAYETMLGGPPYGETFQNWLKYAPAFNAQNVQAPLLMEYMSSGGRRSEPLSAYEFFTALKRQGKPVELYFYPKGEHILDTPWERVASLQRNLDWFRFWMQGYEGTAPDYDPDQYVRWRELRKQHEANQKKQSSQEEAVH